ncbi:bacillolysin/thermolysin/neutral peptidase B [Melghirimyces profundicolus]|uniref:Neutral metalloproteinase n=1 Tax=Melghirimyces profundicolus TaxID=1242148 RepID=A0A2T6C8E9_9BACL|nr:M4 family metallopeptidase [Melghirimyces profundicolus]PTX64579.1 bacillolysin/thermolysin/neutral peptidase B [Melghirimyces profundicolus]
MRRKTVIALLAASLLLGTTPSWTGAASAPRDKSKQQFQTRSEGTLKVRYDRREVPVFVSGKLEQEESSRAADALRFLDRHRDFFKMNRPERDLKVIQTEKDDRGFTHIRFQQMKNGIPVDGAVIAVHFDKENTVRTVNGHFRAAVDDAALDTNTQVSEETAVQKAKRAVSAPENLNYEPQTELVVYPFNETHHLTYKVNLNFFGKEPGNWFVYVDAKTGHVVDQYNAIMDAGELKPATASGIGVKGDHRVLHVSHQKPVDENRRTFFMRDISHPSLDGILTYDFQNQWRSPTNQLPGQLFTDGDTSWKDPYQAAAVDAHYNSEIVYDYFLEKHGRNSIDGKGMPIVSTVHYGEDYNNAFWNGQQMTYGDGDGKFFIPLSAGLDVAAHEMTHGVTTHSANLRYRFQSGALNEAFSDIFGALIDDEDWEIGEDIMAPDAIASGRTSLRSLEEPGKYKVNQAYWPYGDGSGNYPAHMDEYYDLPLELDNGGVHINSSIINHAAYLIGEEIGKEKLGDICYRALTAYLTPDSDFSDARDALIQAASDLYGESSAEQKTVESGLDAVGIRQ